MITTQQLYEDSVENMLLLHFNETTEEMTHQNKNQRLCRYHREMYQRHQNEKVNQYTMKNHNYQKYVWKKIYSCA